MCKCWVVGFGRNEKTKKCARGFIFFFFSSGWGCLCVKLELHPARAFTCTDVAFNQGDVNTAAAFLEWAVWEM